MTRIFSCLKLGGKLMSTTNLILAQHNTFLTEHLFLRKLKLEDATEMNAFTSDPEVARYMSWLPHESLEETQRIIANLFLPNQLHHWGIVEKKSHTLIGVISLSLHHPHLAEFGWMLHRNYWGKSYMAEAALPLLQLCFEDLALDVVQAKHLSENQKSGRVMEKIGMRNLGHVFVWFPKFEKARTADYWALSAEDYFRQKQIT